MEEGVCLTWVYEYLLLELTRGIVEGTGARAELVLQYGVLLPAGGPLLDHVQTLGNVILDVGESILHAFLYIFNEAPGILDGGVLALWV